MREFEQAQETMRRLFQKDPRLKQRYQGRVAEVLLDSPLDRPRARRLAHGVISILFGIPNTEPEEREVT